MDNSFPTMLARDEDVEQVLTDFMDAWKRGNPAPLTPFLERIQNESPEVRESAQLLLVLRDQTLRWRMWSRQRELMGDTGTSPDAPTEPSGRAPLLEDYVRHCSLDGGLESLPPEMVAHEFRLRVECGDTPTMEDYLQRFPHLAPTLSPLLKQLTQELDLPLTTTEVDAPTVIDPALTRLEVPASPLATTLPVSPEEMPKRRKAETDRTTNFGQYELLNEIARGAMGIVYRARQEPIGRIVALKTILAGQFASELQVDQFMLEAQNAGQLKHDNIVTIYDAGKINEQYFIAMAYIEGHSLADLVREKSMSAQRSAEIVEAVARALHFAHVQPQPVYHRDIKPANILLDHAGRPYVTDFGIAKRVEREDSTDGGEDDIAGTPSYMPPEQTYGRDIGPWSDVYSTGALLYHLLTGRPPFLAESLLETIRQVRGTEPLPPRELNPKVDPDLEAVCLKCLEKDRTKRYLSAEHLADDLRRFLKHEPTTARPISQLARFNKWGQRNPVVASLTMLTAALLIVVAAGAIKLFLDQRELTKAETIKRDDADQLAKQQTQLAEAEKKRREDADKLVTQANELVQNQKELVRQQTALAVSETAKRTAADKLVEQQKELARQQTALADAEKAKSTAAETTARKEKVLRDEAQKNLERAIEAVDVILTQSADSGLKDVPGMEDFRKRVAQSAMEQLKPIIDSHPEAKGAFKARARLLVVQAKLLNLTGESQKAVPVLKDAVKEYLELTKAPNGGNQQLLLDLVATYRQLGESLADQAEVDHSSSERRLESVPESLLKDAVKEFENALAVQDGRPASVATDCRWETELARTHQSRCIALIYLKRADEGIEPLERAISSLRDGLDKLPPMAARRDAERQLGSCYSTLAMAESLEESRPSADALKKRLKRLEEAKAIHERLLRDGPKAAETRFDLGMTHYSIARVLTSLALALSDKSQFALAWDKVEESIKAFSVLAGEFPKTPTYEYRRIGALQLKAAILAAQDQNAAAVEILKDAEMDIQTYNDKFTEARQPNLRLRICVSVLELYIAEFSTADILERKSTAAWLKERFGSLRQTSNQGEENPEAKMLESVAERFLAAVSAEQNNQLPKWLSELKSAELDLRDYGKTIPDPKALGEHLRLRVCRETLVKAGRFLKKSDQTTLADTLRWTVDVLPGLTKSKDRKVAEDATELLRFVSDALKSML
ncbi:hypothetical protein LBMAG52_40600 [Planctomycetia bacterium]|nr:hypothetical protein LBMAG52_40600 [Planctomycetia bacterium]